MRKATSAALGLAIGTALATAGAVVMPVAASAAEPEPGSATEDFNGDGFQDMAVGAPGKGGDAGSAGYVTVFYGTASGLDKDNAVTISQDTEGVPGEAVDGNQFGLSLATTDLDQDGYTDIAVTTPGTNQVIVLWGGETGITGKESSVIESEDSSPRGVGRFLTAGDFNGDGTPDLLMQRGGERGMFNVLQGPFNRDAEWTEEQRVQLSSGDNDVLAINAGDVTGDGADDLVVHQMFEEKARDGLFFTGGEDGLTHDGELPMGAGAAVGDFNGDGFGDIAYREVPGGIIEDLPYDAGTIKVVYGTEQGPGDRVDTFTQETPGVPGSDEDGDQFGARLAAGDVTGDGRDDLAVGVPFEGIEDKDKAGAVVLLKSSSDGLTGEGARAFHQDTAGIVGVAEEGDRFGSEVRLLDVNNDGQADLTVGAPGEAIEDVRDGGAIWYLPGTSEGLTASGSNAVNPTDIDAELPGVRFGATLTNSGYAPLMTRD